MIRSDPLAATFAFGDFELDWPSRELRRPGSDCAWIEDERVRKVLINRFPLTRNWVSDSDGEFMDGVMRGDKGDPATSTKPYVEWERGPVTSTAVGEMTGWVIKTVQAGRRSKSRSRTRSTPRSTMCLSPRVQPDCGASHARAEHNEGDS